MKIDKFLKDEASGEAVQRLRDKLVRSRTEFYNMPDSPASNLILETMILGKNIVQPRGRKKQINHNTSYAVLANSKSRQVMFESDSSDVTIELADIEKLTGSNKPAKKLFVLSLIKANEQAIHGGRLTKDYISFPLKELIYIGFYKTLQSARTGFKSGMDVLTSLKIKGRIQNSVHSSRIIEALEVLFTGFKIEKGQCVIYFNPRISWSFIAQYFTILPPYYFRLQNRASDLLYYIFFLARQHTRDIKQKGYFTISFRAIQHRMQLPSEIGNENPYRTIKQPIEDAIEQIEVEHHHNYKNLEFSLIPVCNDEAPIKQFLDNGYCKVQLNGIFASTFVSISKDTKNQISP